MTSARAFPIVRYNPAVAGDPGRLLAPPYDVISEDERAQMATVPCHSVHLELPDGGDPTRAGELLREWRERGVLDNGEVGIVVVQQRYVGPDGVRRTRIGVACEVQLHDFDEGKVLPHEQTFEGPRRERLELMRQTRANISPVFMLYHDEQRSLRDLLASATDEEPDFASVGVGGAQIAVWYVTDLAICEQFEAAVAPHALLIADGHHRYTAALEYRDEVRATSPSLSLVGGRDVTRAPHTDSSGAAGVLAIVCNSADEGICVFPTHRVITGTNPRLLEEFVLGSGAFSVEEHDGVETAMAALEQLDLPGFVVYGAGRARLFSVPDASDLELAAPGTSDAYRRLDVVALHSLVIDGGAVLGDHSDRTHYTRSLEEAVRLADEADDRLAFLLRSADVADVHAVAAAGELLPQKSTYFYPKVPTGVAFRLLDA